MTELETLNAEISEFYEKYNDAELKTPEVLNAYIADT